VAIRAPHAHRARSPNGRRHELRLLQRRIVRSMGRGCRPSPSWFDVLAIGPLDLRTLPLHDRKALLEGLVAKAKGAIRSVPYVVDDGRQIAAFIESHDLEGYVVERVTTRTKRSPTRSRINSVTSRRLTP
jgi:ATP-dependent DNA ligase